MSCASFGNSFNATINNCTASWRGVGQSAVESGNTAIANTGTLTKNCTAGLEASKNSCTAGSNTLENACTAAGKAIQEGCNASSRTVKESSQLVGRFSNRYLNPGNEECRMGCRRGTNASCQVAIATFIKIKNGIKEGCSATGRCSQSTAKAVKDGSHETSSVVIPATVNKAANYVAAKIATIPQTLNNTELSTRINCAHSTVTTPQTVNHTEFTISHDCSRTTDGIKEGCFATRRCIQSTTKAIIDGSYETCSVEIPATANKAANYVAAKIATIPQTLNDTEFSTRIHCAHSTVTTPQTLNHTEFTISHDCSRTTGCSNEMTNTIPETVNKAKDSMHEFSTVVLPKTAMKVATVVKESSHEWYCVVLPESATLAWEGTKSAVKGTKSAVNCSVDTIKTIPKTARESWHGTKASTTEAGHCVTNSCEGAFRSVKETASCIKDTASCIGGTLSETGSCSADSSTAGTVGSNAGNDLGTPCSGTVTGANLFTPDGKKIYQDTLDIIRGNEAYFKSALQDALNAIQNNKGNIPAPTNAVWNNCWGRILTVLTAIKDRVKGKNNEVAASGETSRTLYINQLIDSTTADISRGISNSRKMLKALIRNELVPQTQIATL